MVFCVSPGLPDQAPGSYEGRIFCPVNRTSGRCVFMPHHQNVGDDSPVLLRETLKTVPLFLFRYSFFCSLLERRKRALFLAVQDRRTVPLSALDPAQKSDIIQGPQAIDYRSCEEGFLLETCFRAFVFHNHYCHGCMRMDRQTFRKANGIRCRRVADVFDSAHGREWDYYCIR